MPKTNFSKSELIMLHDKLISSGMLPCDEITVMHDPYHSGKFAYNIICFVKGKQQLNVVFITRTVPKTTALRKQLKESFGKERYANS